MFTSIFRWFIMMYPKEFQRDGMLLLSIVDKEDDNPRPGRCFWIYRSLRRPRANQTPVIESLFFPSKFSIQVGKGAEDGSVEYFLQSTYHDKSSLLTQFPVLVEMRVIRGSVCVALLLRCDMHVVHAFCESWCPTTNTLHTISGEMSISLWDLHKLGRLPINGKIYDEIISYLQAFEHWDKQNLRTMPSSCKFLFATFRYLKKMSVCEKGVSAKAWIDF